MSNNQPIKPSACSLRIPLLLFFVTCTCLTKCMFFLERLEDQVADQHEIEEFEQAKCLRDCKDGNLAKVKEHIEVRGIDPNAPLNFWFERNSGGVLLNNSTFLHGLSDNIEMLEYLIEKGARVNTCDGNYWTPAMCACARLYPEALACLLKHNADISYADQTGNMALHYALMQAYDGRALIRKKERINKKKEALRIIALLKQHGADCNTLNKAHKSPVHYAAMSQDFDIVLATIAPAHFENQLKEQALPRLRCFMLANQHLKKEKLHSLPKDICKKIIWFMAVDCTYAGVQDKLGTMQLSQEAFDGLFVQEIKRLIAQSLSASELEQLKATLHRPDDSGRIPWAIASNDPKLKTLLNSQDW